VSINLTPSISRRSEQGRKDGETFRQQMLIMFDEHLPRGPIARCQILKIT
jgi:hypothetical protein